MPGSLTDLAKQMRSLAVSIPSRANELKKNVVRTINFDLLQSTPVDTGLAVSNWIVNLDGPVGISRPAFVPSQSGFSKQVDGVKEWTHRSDTEATRQINIEPAIAAAEEVLKDAIPGQPIHLTNVLPYIQALDQGHSTQAVLFVDRAIILGTDTVSRAKLTG